MGAILIFVYLKLLEREKAKFKFFASQKNINPSSIPSAFVFIFKNSREIWELLLFFFILIFL